jgi:hypothetical protein
MRCEVWEFSLIFPRLRLLKLNLLPVQHPQYPVERTRELLAILTTNSTWTAVRAQTNLVCGGRKLRNVELWDEISYESVGETSWRKLNPRQAVYGHSAARAMNGGGLL